MMHRTLDLDFDKLAELMREVGFIEVVLRPFKIPIGRWPSDPKLKEAGALQLVAMVEGIEALSMAIFTRCLHWQPEELQILLAQARNDFRMRKTYLYWPWYAQHSTCSPRLQELLTRRVYTNLELQRCHLRQKARLKRPCRAHQTRQMKESS
jgi:hypothetical protein